MPIPLKVGDLIQFKNDNYSYYGYNQRDVGTIAEVYWRRLRVMSKDRGHMFTVYKTYVKKVKRPIIVLRENTKNKTKEVVK